MTSPVIPLRDLDPGIRLNLISSALRPDEKEHAPRRTVNKTLSSFEIDSVKLRDGAFARVLVQGVDAPVSRGAVCAEATQFAAFGGYFVMPAYT